MDEKTANLPDSRSQRRHRHSVLRSLGIKKRAVSVCILSAVVVLVAALQWFAAQSQRPAGYQSQQQLLLDELAYGLAQCALNTQRPTVDYGLATARLSVPRTGPLTILLNATLLDGDGSVTAGVTIVLKDSIFVQVSQTDMTVFPSDATVHDLAGRVVTPGLVDMHSHVGVRETPQLWATEDVSEVSSPLAPWGRAIDGFKPHDQAIPVIASGGVTTVLVLTGAKMPISGEGVVVKMKPAASVLGMLVDVGEASPKPQRYLKMAMGENQKKQFQGSGGRGPETRIGESYWFRKAYDAARSVQAEQDRWCAAAGDSRSTPYPRSLEWQTLVDVLRGDVRINVHGYETEDILAMLDHADEFGFAITAWHHALYADRVADALRARNITVVAFADSWGDKKELYNVSTQLPRRVVEAGVPLVLTRDHPALHGQWLFYEAQIAHHFGLDAAHAVSSVTGEPARALGLDHKLGFVRPGYDADLVVWDRHPLRVGAKPLQVFIDGASVVRSAEHHWQQSVEPSYALDAPAALDFAPSSVSCRGQTDVVLRGVHKSFLHDSELVGDNMTAVVLQGRVVCVGSDKQCQQEIGQARQKSAIDIQLHDGYLLPGLTVVTRQHGLNEMWMEPSTTDGMTAGDRFDDPPETRFGLKFDGIHLERAHRGGVTRLITPPQTTGFFHGISARFRAGATSVLDIGAISEPRAALHFTIGHDGKNAQTPSISTQIGTLHRLLTAPPPETVFAAAANGSLPVVVHTNNKDVMAHVIAIKHATGGRARLVILGGAEAHLLATALAATDVPVIMAPFWGCEPLFWEARHCLPGPPLVDAYGPQVLLEAGVKVALGNYDPSNSHVRNSLWEAAWMAGRGNESLAARLVSTNLEAMLGLPPAGDVVVYEGSPFEYGGRVALSIEEGSVQLCFPDPD